MLRLATAVASTAIHWTCATTHAPHPSPPHPAHPCPPTRPADPLLIMKRPTDLSCLLAVRNRLAAAIAHREMPPLTGAPGAAVLAFGDRHVQGPPCCPLAAWRAAHCPLAPGFRLGQFSPTTNDHPPPAVRHPPDEKRQCNWCFQQANCMVAHAAQRGAAAATPDSFVRPFGDRGAPLDNVQQELAGKYERAAGHMTGSGARGRQAPLGAPGSSRGRRARCPAVKLPACVAPSYCNLELLHTLHT